MPYKILKETLETAHPTLLLKENQRLSQYTTFQIGGTCPLMVFPTTQDQLISCITEGNNSDILTYPLGNGSNLLVSDEGVPHFFISTKKLTGLTLLEDGKIQGEAGVSLGKIATFAQTKGLSGFEFAHGIPGTLGGGILMNAGAYGGEMSQVVVNVTSYCPETQKIITRTSEELEFSYRHSLFSHKKEWILSAILSLPTGDSSEISAKMKELSAQRREKQPLDFPSCGSTFKRPPNHFAAALIDQCGLKGYSEGGAQVSAKHAGFVVNTGNATCHDVLSLTSHVKEVVRKETGISLELEVILL